MYRLDLGGVFLIVISHKRPQNVAPVSALTGPATWLVAPGQERDYAAAVAAAGGELRLGRLGVTQNRNAALELAFSQKLPCAMLADDLRGWYRAVRYDDNDGDGRSKGKPRYGKEPITIKQTYAMLWDGLEATGARLAGAAPTDNAFFTNFEQPIRTAHFIIGNVLLIRPCPLRFDEHLRDKDDYDYTLQHLARYGVVARHDQVLADFRVGKGAGGIVDARTEQLAIETVAYLQAKWGTRIMRTHPRRKHEVLLCWPRMQTVAL
jgi:hypothetical protein